MLKGILYLYVFLIFISCANKNTIIMRDYEGKTIKDASLLVILTDLPTIENGDDVVDDLGEGVPEDIYLDYFQTNIPAYIKDVATFKNVFIDTIFNRIELVGSQQTFRDKEKIKIKVPKNKHKTTYGSHEVDFILFLQELRIYRKEVQNGTWTAGTPSTPFSSGSAPTYSGGKFPELVHIGKFTLWDNRLSQIVSYGKLEVKKAFFFGMTKDTWSSGIHEIGLTIFKNSPFKTSKKRNKHK